MKTVRDFFGFLFVEAKKNNIVNLSAQMAYRVLFGFIPLLMLVYYFLNQVSSELNETMLVGLSKILPPEIMKYIISSMQNPFDTTTSPWTNVVFGIFILYVSVSAMHALIDAFNRILGQEETRGLLALWGHSAVYLLLFVVLVLLTLVLYVFGEHL